MGREKVPLKTQKLRTAERMYSLFIHGSRELVEDISRSSAQQAGYGLPRYRMVADHAERRRNWDGENQTHAAPHPSPEQQRDGDGDGIELHLTADELRRNQVLPPHVDSRQNYPHQPKVAHPFPFHPRH